MEVAGQTGPVIPALLSFILGSPLGLNFILNNWPSMDIDELGLFKERICHGAQQKVAYSPLRGKRSGVFPLDT